MYFESHAHYDDRRFKEDREELLELLPDCKVGAVINSASDMKSSRFGIKLAEKYDYVYAAVGVHPHELHNMTDENINELRRLAGHKKVVAIGEIGLDYYYDSHPRDIQRLWFEKQLQLAKEINIPVIIHSRDAAAECFDIIAESGVNNGVIHCYSGSKEMAKDYIKMGYYIGIGGVLTFQNAKKLIEVVEVIPLEHILIETDAPYLSPAPNRGQRNDSRNLEFVVKKIAEIKNISTEIVEDVTFSNGKKLFLK